MKFTTHETTAHPPTDLNAMATALATSCTSGKFSFSVLGGTSTTAMESAAERTMERTMREKTNTDPLFGFLNDIMFDYFIILPVSYSLL